MSSFSNRSTAAGHGSRFHEYRSRSYWASVTVSVASPGRHVIKKEREVFSCACAVSGASEMPGDPSPNLSTAVNSTLRCRGGCSEDSHRRRQRTEGKSNLLNKAVGRQTKHGPQVSPARPVVPQGQILVAPEYREN